MDKIIIINIAFTLSSSCFVGLITIVYLLMIYFSVLNTTHIKQV